MKIDKIVFSGEEYFSKEKLKECFNIYLSSGLAYSSIGIHLSNGHTGSYGWFSSRSIDLTFDVKFEDFAEAQNHIQKCKVSSERENLEQVTKIYKEIENILKN